MSGDKREKTNVQRLREQHERAQTAAAAQTSSGVNHQQAQISANRVGLASQEAGILALRMEYREIIEAIENEQKRKRQDIDRAIAASLKSHSAESKKWQNREQQKEQIATPSEEDLTLFAETQRDLKSTGYSEKQIREALQDMFPETFAYLAKHDQAKSQSNR